MTKNNASTEGNRVLIGVMVKDRERFADTGGWGFEAWAGDSRDERLVKDGGASCYGCHTEKRERDFVFTEWRD
ncbi:MAG: cytochrome P460 family protein [Pseudomonadota bacterium]|nr:cytochrome P460 family protein [Pseudomonadota bacterium]